MKNETKWELKRLGEYARYFLIIKNAIDRVVREYAEHLTETLNIDKESGQPDFEQLKIQCKNIKIARDKADELLSWYYACYLTIATNIDDIPVIPTEHPDANNVQPLYSCPNEKTEIKELRDAIQDDCTDELINDIISRLPKDKEDFINHNCEEEQEDEGTNKTGE